MVNFRELRLQDVDNMFEIISDLDVANNFIFTRFPFSRQNLEDFIKDSWGNKQNIHFAIADEQDEYAGTISLKNINYIDRNAEYAIVVRKKYWGKKFAYEATKHIIDYGFNKLNLNKIYLNVLSSNTRANVFYERFGFVKEAIFKQHMFIAGEYEDLNWYYMLKSNESWGKHLNE